MGCGPRLQELITRPCVSAGSFVIPIPICRGWSWEVHVRGFEQVFGRNPGNSLTGVKEQHAKPLETQFQPGYSGRWESCGKVGLFMVSL